MLSERLENLATTAPLVHCITNYVTVNDCANILLACGASPIMADDPQEVEEITSACSALVLNIGTLNHTTIPSMLAAGKKAAALGHPVVLDPVGAGASRLRTETARLLLREVRPSIIRANMSEIKALVLDKENTRGVDASQADQMTEQSQAAAFARQVSVQTGALVIITGATDIVSDGQQTFCIHNGHPMMSRVTGTGCQLSAMTAAYAAANPGHLTEAAVAAVCAMGLCGETAWARLGAQDGNAALRQYILDAVYRLTPADLERGARYDKC